MNQIPDVPVVAAAEIGESDLKWVRQLVRSHHGLKTVLDWCLRQKPPITNTAVVTQDEFTHDLIVPHPSGLYLVYDST